MFTHTKGDNRQARELGTRAYRGFEGDIKRQSFSQQLVVGKNLAHSVVTQSATDKSNHRIPRNQLA